MQYDEDRDPAWWEGFYREEVVTDSGRVVRKRRSVKPGLQKDVPTEAHAKRRLAKILFTINDDGYRPRSAITFRAFVQKYRDLKLATKKRTTQHGKAAQERLGHFRPDILLKFYAHVLDASADMAASTLSRGLGARSATLEDAYKAVS